GVRLPRPRRPGEPALPRGGGGRTPRALPDPGQRRAAGLPDPEGGRPMMGIKGFPRSHAPRENAVRDALRPRECVTPVTRRGASKTAFPRGAWERGSAVGGWGSEKIVKYFVIIISLASAGGCEGFAGKEAERLGQPVRRVEVVRPERQ